MQSLNKHSAAGPCRCKSAVVPAAAPVSRRPSAAHLRKALQVATKRAQKIGEQHGQDTPKFRVAWDVVCDLTHAYYEAYEREAYYVANPIEAFCEENPDADECRLYDV